MQIKMLYEGKIIGSSPHSSKVDPSAG